MTSLSCGMMYGGWSAMSCGSTMGNQYDPTGTGVERFRAQVSTPIRQYTKEVGYANDIWLGDVISCDAENMTIQRVDYTESQKVISAGRMVETYKSAWAAMARRIEAVEKIIL